MPTNKKTKDTAKKYSLLTADQLPPLEFVPSGFGDLDLLTGGFPRSRITELYGLQGVGKTTLTLMAIAASTEKGLKTLFIDCENGFNPIRAEKLGVDLKHLSLAKMAQEGEAPVSMLEDVSEVLMNEIKNFDMIIVDSVAAMVPRAEIEGEAGDANVGLKARLMGQLIRKVNLELGKSKCALIFINQLRESMDMYAPKYSTTGGNALRFFSSLRIELISYSRDNIERTTKGVKSRVGKKVTAKIIKSRMSKPFAEVSFELMY